MKILIIYVRELIRSFSFWIGLIPYGIGIYQTFINPVISLPLDYIQLFKFPLFILFYLIANLFVYKGLYNGISEADYNFPLLKQNIQTKIEPQPTIALISTRFLVKNSSKYKAKNFNLITTFKNNEKFKKNIISTRSDWVPDEEREFEVQFAIPLTKDQFSLLDSQSQSGNDTNVRKILKKIPKELLL